MSDSLYVTSMEPRAGKATISLGVLETLARHVERIAVFRPVVAQRDDWVAELLRARHDLQVSAEETTGCTYDEAVELQAAGDGRLLEHVLERYAALRDRFEFVLCVGTDYVGPTPATELGLNATFAVNLGTPVLAVVPGGGRRPDAAVATAARARREFANRDCSVVATVVNRVDPELVPLVREAAARRTAAGEPPTYVLPNLPVLSSLTVEEVATALDARPLAAGDETSQREVDAFTVGTGHLETVLANLRDATLLVTSGDRTDLAVAAAACATSPALPTPAAVVLTLNGVPNPDVAALLAPSGLPVLTTALDTYHALHTLDGLHAEIRPTSTRKIAAALGAFSEAVDAVPGGDLAARIRLSRTDVVTPLMFSAELLERARRDRRHIVLPEGEDDRVLRAAEEITRRRVARLTLLGDPEAVVARAALLDVDLNGVEVVDPVTSELREQFAETYAQLRAHKGATRSLAYDLVTDVSYFGTLLVHAGLADGMVSGAAHTTAATIRPALEIIRTAPGTSLVSSTFLMCLPDRVLAFADCAVVPNPTSEQLADIAVSTAETAAAFGIDPRVAMVSYSTGASGTGADVDKVRRATELVAERRPDLPLAGPIQYDAAVDPSVGAAKLPGNETAGHATVLIFPDLNTGNTTYKAVQRAADAIAVGPVLQGLRRPVNDLSRGCTVDDIVHTVAITAVQAQTLAAAGSAVSDRAGSDALVGSTR